MAKSLLTEVRKKTAQGLVKLFFRTAVLEQVKSQGKCHCFITNLRVLLLSAPRCASASAGGELAVLKEVAAALGSALWSVSWNFSDTHYCHFEGVTCEHDAGEITDLCVGESASFKFTRYDIRFVYYWYTSIFQDTLAMFFSGNF